MDSDSTAPVMDGSDFAARWKNIQYLLTRGSPLAHPDFEPSPEVSKQWSIYNLAIIFFCNIFFVRH